MRLLLLTGLLHVVLSVQVISDEDGSTTETAAHADANPAAQATQDGGSFAPTINADGHIVGANGRKIKRIVITRKHKKPANQSFDAQYEVVSQSRKETKINDKETEITETITTSDGRTITKKIRKKRIPAPAGQSQTVPSSGTEKMAETATESVTTEKAMDSANSTPLAQDGSSSGMASGQQDMSATTVKPKKKRIRRKTVRRTILDPNYKITTPAYSEQILSKDGDGKNPVKVEEAIIETFINADGTKTVKKTTKSKQFSPDEEGDGGDSGDAAEGSDTTDSPDSNDTNDSANTDDTSESPEGTDSGESTDSSEPADSGEPTESSESADSDESTESSESSDTTDDPGSSDSGVTESSSETDNSAATDTDEETVVGSSTTSTGLVIIKKKRKVTKVKVRKGGKKGMKGGMKGGPKGGMKRVQGRRGGRRMMNGRMGGRMRGRGGRRPNKVMVRFNAPEMSDMANSTTPVNETMANNATQTDMGSMAPGNNDSNQTENGETTTSGGQATTEQVVVTTETSMTTSTDSMSSPETAVETTTTTTIMTETSSPANGAKADPNGTVLKDETVTTSTGKKVHKRTIRRKKMKPGQNVTVSPDGAQSTTSSSISTKPSVPQAEEVQSLNIIELFTKVAK